MSKSIKRVALVLREISDHLRGNMFGILNYVRKIGGWEVYTQGALPRLPWENLDDWHGDGMIVAIDTQQELQRVIDKGVPTVNVSSRLAELPVPSVVSNNQAIGAMAAQHLIERGLKHFAFLGPMDLDHNVKRFQGFADALRQAGLDCQPHPIRYVRRQLEFDKHSVVDLNDLAAYLRGLPFPVGVFAPHDDLGWWVLKACADSRLAVPGQVAVVGVDNYELLCEFTSPPLTSVAQSSYRIGFEAARMLDQLMAGKTLSRSSLFVPPFRVVARQSTDVFAVDDEDVAAALRYIRNHADESIGVSDILERISVSRRSLEIRFKKAIGHSVEQEIINSRITRAKQLLSDTSLPITQVALNSGYQSSTGFSVAFRKETGMSPREYRKQIRAPLDGD